MVFKWEICYDVCVGMVSFVCDIVLVCVVDQVDFLDVLIKYFLVCDVLVIGESPFVNFVCSVLLMGEGSDEVVVVMKILVEVEIGKNI